MVQLVYDARMVDIYELPVPDWDLRCPCCDNPLAGMAEHRCERCRQAFNIRHLLAIHRPVADLGLTCGECGYLLTGLTVDRCPKCGTPFSVREMLKDLSPAGEIYLSQAKTGGIHLTQIADPPDHRTLKRDPAFTGYERPLPDFALSCAGCGHPLAGAPGDACPACDLPFDLLAIVPRRDWVDISQFVPRSLAAIAKNVLYTAQIPYVIDNAKLSELYGGNIPFISGKLRVPRPFFFDALHALAVAVEPPPVGVAESWTCPACSERVPGGFEVCWNCNAPHPNHTDDETGPGRLSK